MTDISVITTNSQVEDRSWLIVQPGAQGSGYSPGKVLDISTFTANTHYPNGFIPSGMNLGKITATGLYGPYDDAASDGRQTFAGWLFSATKVPNVLDTTKDVGAGVVVAFAVVRLSRLPIALDANGQTDAKANFNYLEA